MFLDGNYNIEQDLKVYLPFSSWPKGLKDPSVPRPFQKR